MQVCSSKCFGVLNYEAEVPWLVDLYCFWLWEEEEEKEEEEEEET